MKNPDIKIKVGVIIENEKGEVLLIKEKIKKNKEPRWNIIKGTYNGGETILDTVTRECQEEAILNVDIVGFLGAYVSEKEEKTRLQFNFITTPQKGNEVFTGVLEEIEDEEILEVRYFSKTEINEMNKDDFVSNIAYTLINTFRDKPILPTTALEYISM